MAATHIYNVDDEVKRRVKDAPEVRRYLEELQSIYITANIVVRVSTLYYIMLLLFCLPTAWVVWSLANSQEVPRKLYYDSCVDSRDTSRVYSFADCYSCANNRSFLWSHLVVIPHSTQNAGIIVAVVVGVLAVIFYARLVLQENVAHHLLEYGVVVKSPPFSLAQVWPTLFFTAAFGAVAAINIAASTEITKVLTDRVILGLEDKCDNSSRLAGRVLWARFEEDNPSVRSSAAARDVYSVIKLLLAVFLPFVPILSKFHSATTSTYSSRLTLDALVRSQRNSAQLFRNLVYEIDEADVMKAIGIYAQRVEDPVGCSLRNLMRHILLGSCSFAHPLPPLFGMESAWGNSLEDVHHVLTIAAHNNTLRPYVEREADGTASPTMPPGSGSGKHSSGNTANDPDRDDQRPLKPGRSPLNPTASIGSGAAHLVVPTVSYPASASAGVAAPLLGAPTAAYPARADSASSAYPALPTSAAGTNAGIFSAQAPVVASPTVYSFL